jgi:acyl-CoA synthetase (AMP-forming)/AMP-acid ligase II
MSKQGVYLPLAASAAGLTMADLFAQQVRRSGESIAVEDKSRRWTYGQLDERVNRLANALLARGASRGDRVAILSENRTEYIELQLAAAKLGVILACQNWRQSDVEVEYCIRLVSPRILFVSERFSDTAARIHHGVDMTLGFGSGYESMLANAGSQEPGRAHLDPEDGLVILYTSGTTGLPKGALISQRAMVARGMVARIDSPVQPGDTFIAWAPLFHMVSTDPAFATLTHGGKVIVMDGLDVKALVEATARERVGHLILMPGMIDRVIDELNRTGTRPKGARIIGCMADLVPLDQIAKITALYQAPYRNSFGSTETGSCPASRGAIPVGAVPERLSKLQNSFCSVRLIDEDDNEVPDGVPGELTFRGPTLFSGYWGNPEANARDFRNGWFHMGDVVVRNPDGTLDFVDRRKYLIKSGGENIYPAEIERVLLACDRVLDAVVVRKKDARWGEVPVAFVVKADTTLTAVEVIALCRQAIASYKLPKEVVFVEADELPRSTTGKVKRHELEGRLNTA